MSKIAFLTIDDAPSTDFIEKLNFLETKGVKAVWFCEGQWLDERMEYAIEAVKRGHILGNHAYSHPNFSNISLKECYAQIRSTDALVEEAYNRAGVARRFRYFRFPYGDKGDGRWGNNLEQVRDAEGEERHAAIQSYLRRLGYRGPNLPEITYTYYDKAGLREDVDFYWTYDTHDWAMNNDNPPYGLHKLADLLKRTDEDVPEGMRGLNYAGSAELIIMHDHIYQEPVFTSLINRLLEKGIQFIHPGR